MCSSVFQSPIPIKWSHPNLQSIAKNPDGLPRFIVYSVFPPLTSVFASSEATGVARQWRCTLLARLPFDAETQPRPRYPVLPATCFARPSGRSWAAGLICPFHALIVVVICWLDAA
jgi:hypothetical protein